MQHHRSRQLGSLHAACPPCFSPPQGQGHHLPRSLLTSDSSAPSLTSPLATHSMACPTSANLPPACLRCGPPPAGAALPCVLVQGRVRAGSGLQDDLGTEEAAQLAGETYLVSISLGALQLKQRCSWQDG